MLSKPLSTHSCLPGPCYHRGECQAALWDYGADTGPRHLGEGLFPELQIRAPTWASYCGSFIPGWLLITPRLGPARPWGPWGGSLASQTGCREYLSRWS